MARSIGWIKSQARNMGAGPNSELATLVLYLCENVDDLEDQVKRLKSDVQQAHNAANRAASDAQQAISRTR